MESEQILYDPDTGARRANIRPSGAAIAALKRQTPEAGFGRSGGSSEVCCAVYSAGIARSPSMLSGAAILFSISLGQT